MSYIETRLIIDGKSYDGRQIELIELGRNVERERIIKLLENQCKCSPDRSLCWAAKGIELIKGETNE